MSKIKLKRSLMLAALFSAGSNAVSAAIDYDAITDGTVRLENGDTVTSSASNGINSSTAGSGVQVNGATKIKVVHTGSESKGVYLDNGARNNLGSGTSVTVENTGGASHLITVGVSVENKNNIGIGLVANNLTVTATNDTHVSGVSSSGSGNVTIDLGNKSEISATTTGTSSLVRAIDLGTNSTFKINEGTINATRVSNPNNVSGQTYGINANGKADIQLGDKTTINATSDSGSTKGIYLSNLGTGTTVTANELQINVSGVVVDGIYGTGNINLGNGGKIDVKGNGTVRGIELDPGSSLKANGLEIVVVATGERYGMGLRIEKATVDLGVGTSINVSNGYGIYAISTGSTIVANGLTVSATKGYGLNIQSGASVNVGTGSIITSSGELQDAVWVVETGAKFEAQGVTLSATGVNARGIATENGGSAKMGAGSHISSAKGGGLIASSNSSINYIGGTTAATRNTITAGGSYGASAQQINTTVNLKNTDVFVNSAGARAYGLWAVSSGVINAENVTVHAVDGVYGIRSNAGGKTNLSGNIVIDASASGVAMLTDGATSWTKGTGKMTISGSLITQNGGLIDLVLENGSVFVGSANKNTGTIKLKMEAGSKWYVTADKCVDLVMEEGSILYLGTPQDQRDFALKNVTNTGKMTVNGGTTWFQADVGSISGDRLVVENAIEGTAGKIAVQNLGTSTTNGTEKLVLVKAKNSGAEFTLINAVEQGGYIYLLDSEPDDDVATGTNWFLYGTKKGTSTGSASVNVFSGGYLLNYADTQTLLQRMGDLRQGEEDRGVWARAYGGKFTSSSDGFLSGFDMTYSGMQVGADKKIALKNKGNIYVGGVFGYSKGNLDYGVGSGSVDSKTLGAYGSYMAPTGFYADLVLKYGWMKNNFKVLDTAGEWVTGDKMNTDGLSASLEVGQRIHFDRKTKEGWYLEPQAQISSGHQSGGSFTASNGLQVNVDSYTSTLGRLGINAGYEVKSGKNPINVYAKVSYVHEFDGDVGYRLNSSREQTSFGDSWWSYGLGITAQIHKKHNVYLDIERASGGQFNQPWSLNGGYRFNW